MVASVVDFNPNMDLAPGSLVAVRGFNFAPTSRNQCKLDEQVVPVLVLNSTVAYCSVVRPCSRLSNVEIVNFGFDLWDHENELNSTRACLLTSMLLKM